MLNTLLHPLKLPLYESLKPYEGKGNWAIKKYYKFPYSFFYQYKLRMILNMMDSGYYTSTLDYGCGPGIFSTELRKHCHNLASIDRFSKIDPRWRFNLIVCSSVLEFTSLDFDLSVLSNIIERKGLLIVASPMNGLLPRLYFKLIKDTYRRHSMSDIVRGVEKHFKIVRLKKWMNLYFCLKAVKK